MLSKVKPFVVVTAVWGETGGPKKKQAHFVEARNSNAAWGKALSDVSGYPERKVWLISGYTKKFDYRIVRECFKRNGYAPGSEKEKQLVTVGSRVVFKVSPRQAAWGKVESVVGDLVRVRVHTVEGVARSVHDMGPGRRKPTATELIQVKNIDEVTVQY
jgi:hypothetical protein